jgi:hypothetical protein
MVGLIHSINNLKVYRGKAHAYVLHDLYMWLEFVCLLELSTFEILQNPNISFYQDL